MCFREKQDLDRAIQASLSTMTEEDMKKVKSKQNAELPSSDEKLVHTEENFPVLGGKPQVQVDTNASSSKPTSTRSLTPVTSVASTAVSNSTTESKTSLADRLAMSNSMSVQHGVFNDFPTLAQPKPRSDRPNNSKPQKSGGGNFKSVFNVQKAEEDFPGLPSSNKANEPTVGTWIQPGKSSSESNKKGNQKKKTSSSQWMTPSSYDVNDFPTLCAPSDKTQTERWFKSEASKSNNSANKKTDNNSNINSNKEMSAKDVIDRFSPVNVPDSPKSERTKNKKKKKKDKVTEIKSEVNGNTASLRGNSSLDDIASLLMIPEKKKEIEMETKDDRVECDEKVEEVSVKAKGKKKIDKIERKMEAEKEVPKLEKLTISEPEEVIQPEPVKFTIANKDFPSIGLASAPNKPPPGFKQESKSVQSTPPGFGKVAARNNKPPPGFGSQHFEACNESTVQYKALPMTADLGNYQYSPPNGFQERNRMLIGTIQSFCAEESTQFSDFKYLSGEFRRSEITASQYYNQCGDILGKENFLEIFPELLALLPDIDKQQELLTVFMQSECMKKDDKVLKISGKSKSAKGAWTKTESAFLTCQTCQQVLGRKDYNDHVSQHNLDTDFPSLGDSIPSQKVGIGGAWIKAN